MNKHFSSCFNTALPQLSQSEILYLDPDKCPSHLLCNESEVYDLLVGVDVTKSTSPDNIAGRMLKSTVCSITPAVTALFNQTIRQGKIPKDWKTARITPVPKASDHTQVENYRPISILPILSKLLERHIYNCLMKHLNDHHPLSDNQWGFTRGKSTVGALLTAVDSWHQLLDSRTDICAVFFDLRKAFDSVPHRLLLNKLYRLGVDPYLLQWIVSYLCERTQSVCINGSSSEPLSVVSGVPQGSVLGPLLFLIYTDDVSQIILSNDSLLLYADDIVLYHPIYCQEDYNSLRNDVDSLCDWTSSAFLYLNAAKCKYMVISRKKQPIVPLTPILVCGNVLERVNSFKYLGVWITKDLTWSRHVNEICTKARRVVGLIYRQYYQYSTPETLNQLYVSFVRPHLEYAAPVWDPHLQKDIDKLEKVQKFALRMCTKNWMAGSDDLLTCNIPSLKTRRLYLKLVFLYQLVNDLIVYPSHGVSHRNLSVNIRHGHPALLHRPFSRTQAYNMSFFPHSISVWNTLPVDVVTSPTLCLFKSHLKYVL